MTGKQTQDLAAKYKLTGNGPWLREVEIADIVVPDIRVTSVMPEELAEQFQGSIEAQGVVNPVKLVYADQKLLLVDGLHRIQAATLAKQFRVPAVIQKADMKEVMLQNLTSGKLQGRGKATDMIRVIQYLVKEHGLTIDEIAARTGYKVRYLADLLSIANAHPDLLQALDEEKIPLGAAIEIARIPDHDTQLKVLWNVIMYRLPVREVKLLVDKTIEELEKRKQTTTQERPKPAREFVLLECHLCEAQVPAKDMRTVFLCPHCMNILWDMKIEARKALEAEQRSLSTSPEQLQEFSTQPGQGPAISADEVNVQSESGTVEEERPS